jgi:hypothetical protein
MAEQTVSLLDSARAKLAASSRITQTMALAAANGMRLAASSEDNPVEIMRADSFLSGYDVEKLTSSLTGHFKRHKVEDVGVTVLNVTENEKASEDAPIMERYIEDDAKGTPTAFLFIR